MKIDLENCAIIKTKTGYIQMPFCFLNNWFALDKCAKALGGERKREIVNSVWFDFKDIESVEKFLHHPAIQDKRIIEKDGVTSVLVIG